MRRGGFIFVMSIRVRRFEGSANHHTFIESAKLVENTALNACNFQKAFDLEFLLLTICGGDEVFHGGLEIGEFAEAFFRVGEVATKALLVTEFLHAVVVELTIDK